jgi:hypothetical protein
MLSKKLQTFREVDPESTISLQKIDTDFGEDGAPLTIIFLCLPFLFPIPIPGISTAFGLAIILLTLRTISPWPLPLPAWADRVKISGKTIISIAEKSEKYVLKFESKIQPRIEFLTEGWFKGLAGFSMILASIALALPIPPVIPFTNTLPALSITLFSLGFLARDGLMIIVGHVLHVASWGYFVSIAGVAFAFVHKLKDYF